MNVRPAGRYYAYILFSLKDRGLYIGYTSDLNKRLRLHAVGKISATKSRLPVLLIHYEYFINRADAKARETFLKSGYGHKQLADILKRTIISLSDS